MGILGEATLVRARQRLEAMVGPVVLQVPPDDQSMQSLAAELADGDLLTVAAGEPGSITLVDAYGRPTGIHFRDLPLGQELDPFLDAILAVSGRGGSLTPLGRTQAQELPEGTELWVLVSTSCTRCAQAVRLAHAIALESRGRLKATAIDLTQHPELITQYGISAVPSFVINQRTAFPGPLPELVLLQRLADQAQD